jgi:hypothetical protein
VPDPLKLNIDGHADVNVDVEIALKNIAAFLKHNCFYMKSIIQILLYFKYISLILS